jgi:hypothetical protein
MISPPYKFYIGGSPRNGLSVPVSAGDGEASFGP